MNRGSSTSALCGAILHIVFGQQGPLSGQSVGVDAWWKGTQVKSTSRMREQNSVFNRRHSVGMVAMMNACPNLRLNLTCATRFTEEQP